MTSTMRIDPVTPRVRSAVDRLGPGLYGVACSGGADSLALAHALIRVAGAPHVIVITIDHGLSRGSEQIAASVAAWASRQGAAAILRVVEVEQRASIEAAARTARYRALEEVADELGLVAVMLGHTARDHAETVLMRIVRGTGPAGLAGIPAARSGHGDEQVPGTQASVRSRGRAMAFVRPLVTLSRDAVDEYAKEHALPVAHDPMNEDLALTRVRFRREIMPALRRENPKLDAALVRLASSAQEWLEVIDGLAAPFARFPITCGALAAQPAAIRKRALALALEAAGLDYDAVHLVQLEQLVLRGSHGAVALDLRGGRVERRYDTLDAHPSQPRSASPETTVCGALAPPAGPFQLRIWQPGDRMRPVRLQGRSRKLSDLFIDAKVPRNLRVMARVLVCTTDGSIVWAEHVGLAFGAAEILTPKPTRTGGSF